MLHLILWLRWLVRINKVCRYKEPKVSVLQANTKLAQKGECWTGSVLIRDNILLLDFFVFM